MFNLLPENLKEKIKSEYRLRLLITIFALVIFLQVFFLVTLLPSWIISDYKESITSSQLSEMKQTALYKDADSVVANIISINTKLNFINTLDYPKVTNYIKVIVSNKSRSVHINRLSYAPAAKNTIAIALGGVSDSREALVVFIKNLKNSGSFKTADLPISDLAKEKNLDFSINLSIAK